MWLYGIHDAGGEHLLLEAGKTGWIVLSEAIGRDRDDRSGRNFLPYRLHKLGVICRLNHGYFPNGTIPLRPHYDDFARRCANFVSASPGCNIWIIGNEPNSEYERPSDQREPALGRVARVSGWARALSLPRIIRGVHGAGLGRMFSTFLRRTPDPATAAQNRTPPDRKPIWPDSDGAGSEDLPLRPAAETRFTVFGSTGDAYRAPGQTTAQRGAGDTQGVPITPEMYADCYARCRRAIRGSAGHDGDEVLVAAVAPWNDQTRYDGNEWGDWVVYFRDVLELLGPDGCDGFALHAYTHHADPRLIESSATLGAPFVGRHAEFRAYRDFLQAVPQSMRHLPVYITEADPTDPWAATRRCEDSHQGRGWIRTAYDEIAAWNAMPGSQTIRCLALYRWGGEYSSRLEGKTGAQADLHLALRGNHRWRESIADAASEDWRPKDRAVTLTKAPLSVRPPSGKEREDGGEVPAFALVEVVDGRGRMAGGTVWRQVREAGGGDGLRQGWLPEYGLGEDKILARLPSRPQLLASNGPSPIRIGDVVRTLDWVRMRFTPGYAGKSAEDVVEDVAPASVLAVTGGPEIADGLQWWLLRLLVDSGNGNVGWMAESSLDGRRLLELESAPPVPPRQPEFAAGERAETLTFVRLRKTPGYVDKPADDVVADLWQGTEVTILGGPQAADGLDWWEVRTKTDEGKSIRGWIAQESPEGIRLLGKRTVAEPPHFEVGDLAVVGAAPVRVRRTAGLLDKPHDDVLGEYRSRSTVVIQDGPTERDEIKWRLAGGIGASGDALIGWVAQTTPDGVLLLGKPLPLPGTDIPNPKTGAFLGTPFVGVYGIGQLWGENSAFYRRYSYDGVPLLGHNGVDFLTPFRTPLRAVDSGTVAVVGFEPGGFGHFVLLAHSWGESVYAHLEQVNVEPGEGLLRGARIGLSGNSGGSTGPHLHFAIRVHPYDRADGWGGYCDPLPYLNPDRVMAPDYVLVEQLRLKPTDESSAFLRLPPSSMLEDYPGLIRP